MATKILAVAAMVTLPLSVSYWHRSYRQPAQYRYDVTLYQSLWVRLKDGVCGLEVLSMPTKTASRTEFRHPLRFGAGPNQESFLFRSVRHGEYRTTWLVFPFWVPTMLLAAVGTFPLIRGPGRRGWRRWRGRCSHCGYDLTGNRSGRCPECGENAVVAARPAGSRSRTVVRAPRR